MYIIYPPREKNWKNHLLTILVLAALYPLLHMGGFSQLIHAKEPAYSAEQAQFEEATHQITTRVATRAGFAGFLKAFYLGSEEVKQIDPLYPLLLLTVYQTELSHFVENARDLNFLLAFLFLCLLLFMLRRTEGEVFALSAVLLFLLPPLLPGRAHLFGPELFVLLMYFGAWFSLVEETEPEAHGLSTGFWVGAAFCTGSLGAGLFWGTLLYFIINYNFKLLKTSSLYYFLLGFTLISSPLLVRDFWLYQNPFYSLLAFFKTVPVWPALLFSNILFWPALIFGGIGIFLDRNRPRRILSVIFTLTAAGWGTPLTALSILIFYCAGLFNAGVLTVLKKGALWLALVGSAALCFWSWFRFFGIT